jgi:hypothetical protein
LNWFAQTIMLFFARWSLVIGRDAVSPWIPAWVEPSGFALVLYTNTFMAQFAYLKERRSEGSRPSPRDPGQGLPPVVQCPVGDLMPAAVMWTTYKAAELPKSRPTPCVKRPSKLRFASDKDSAGGAVDLASRPRHGRVTVPNTCRKPPRHRLQCRSGRIRGRSVKPSHQQRLKVPRRSWEDNNSRSFQQSDDRPGRAGLRATPR